MRSLLTGTTNQQALDDLAKRGPATYWANTGFFDNWQTAIGQMFDSNMSFSRFMNYTLPQRERDLQLERYIDEGKLPLHGMSTHRRSDKARVVDYNSLAHYAKTLGLQTETDEELMERVRSDIKGREAYAADIFRRASFGGRVGQLAGTLHAAAVDPVNFPGYFIGVGAAAKGASYLSKMGRVLALGGGVAAASQAAIEIPFTLRWKHELHMDYDVKDALTNIVMAGAMGTFIPGTAVTVGHVSRSIKSLLASRLVRKAIEENPAAKEAERVLEQIAREADEGLHVGRSPFSPSYEARKAQIEAAFAEYDSLNQRPAGREGLRARLAAEELEGQYFDEFEGTEASATEYWAGIEGTMQRMNDNKPVLSEVVEEVIEETPPTAKPKAPEGVAEEVDEIDTAFKNVVGEADESPFMPDIVKADSELDTLAKFEACLMGAAGV